MYIYFSCILDYILPTDTATICSVDKHSTSFSWKVLNKYHVMSEECKIPIWIQWRRNGTIIANWDKTNTFVVEPNSGLSGRLALGLGNPFGIVLDPTQDADVGNYTVVAGYGSSTIKSETINLQVSVPMSE